MDKYITNYNFCAYKMTIPLTVIKNKTDNEDYVFSMYTTEGPMNGFKMMLVNAKNEQLSYTSIVTKQEYEHLKAEQELITNFENFFKEIQSLVSELQAKNIVAKLKIKDTVQLGFYTMSQLKQLTLIQIPFEVTPTDEIIAYFKLKMLHLEDHNRILDEKNKSLQQELEDATDKYKKDIVFLDKVSVEYKRLEETMKILHADLDVHKKLMSDNEKAKEELAMELVKMEDQNADLRHSLYEMNADLNNMRLGMHYYVEKFNVLRDFANEKEKTTIPIQKYERLYNMFAKAIADLLKNNATLKKISALNELQKKENGYLKDDLTRCMRVIKDMEHNFRKEEKYIPDKDEHSRSLADLLMNLDMKSTAINESKIYFSFQDNYALTSILNAKIGSDLEQKSSKN